MDLPGGIVSVPDGVVRRSFGEDKVLLNLATGHYHGLNPTGERMVDVLEETGNAEETATKLSAELGQPLDRVRDDLAKLCGELLDRGLIVAVRD